MKGEAGFATFQKTGTPLPQETIDAAQQYARDYGAEYFRGAQNSAEMYERMAQHPDAQFVQPPLSFPGYGDVATARQSVKGLRVGVFRDWTNDASPAMREIFQDLNAMADHIMGLLTLDMRDKTYPAGIVLKLRII